MRIAYKPRLLVVAALLAGGSLAAGEKEKQDCCSIDLGHLFGAPGSSLTMASPALVEGNRQSAIRVVIYEDLQCPDCAAFHEMLDRHLLPRYAARVAFEHRDFPLAKHAWARKAAIASRFFASIRPELAIEYRRHALATLAETTADNFNDRLSSFAKAHAVEPARVLAALGDASYAAAVEKEFQEGVARGVRRTPTVFVGGQPLVERFLLEEVTRVLDDALGAAAR